MKAVPRFNRWSKVKIVIRMIVLDMFLWDSDGSFHDNILVSGAIILIDQTIYSNM